MKLLLDLSVLIEFLRNPQKKRAFDTYAQRPLILMSSVVAMELYAGCVNKQQRTAVDGFLEPFQQAGRMVTPDSGVFIEAGRVLALMNREGIGTSHLPQITNDVLIAVSATRAGAAVVTLNIRDFTRIERLTPVRWIAPGPWDQAGRRLTTKP